MELQLGQILAFAGAVISAGFAGIGSAIGVGMAGEALAGLLEEKPDMFGKGLVLQLLPGTQGIYGLLVAFMIVMKVGLLSGTLAAISTTTGLLLFLGAMPAAFARILFRNRAGQNGHHRYHPHRQTRGGTGQGDHDGHHGRNLCGFGAAYIHAYRIADQSLKIDLECMNLSGIEKLTQSILDEAESEARAIFDKAQQHIAQSKEKMLQTIEHRENAILSHAQKNGAEQKKRMLAVYGLELRKDQLKVKREALDIAFEKALSTLNNLPREKYLDLIGKLLAESVSTGSETVLISETEKYIDDAFIGGFNAELQKQGKAGRLLLAKTSEIANGFVLQEGGLVINCSFERVLKELRESTETQAAKILFG